MSILIKGMNMPNDRPIIISIFPNGRVDTMEAKYFDSVLSAVEIPTPHGDLIDRDKLGTYFQLVNDFGDTIGIRHAISINEVEEAPVIIESEE